VEGPPHGRSQPTDVLKYLAAYMTGGPISDRRLISDDDGVVTFWARGKDKAGGNRPEPFRLARHRIRAPLDDAHPSQRLHPVAELRRLPRHEAGRVPVANVVMGPLCPRCELHQPAVSTELEEGPSTPIPRSTRRCITSMYTPTTHTRSRDMDSNVKRPGWEICGQTGHGTSNLLKGPHRPRASRRMDGSWSFSQHRIKRERPRSVLTWRIGRITPASGVPVVHFLACRTRRACIHA
jgi:hypothetical protein